MLSRSWRFAVLALALAPVAAVGDQTAQVVLATPGTGDGAIERFTMRFTDDMVALGDPRATAPAKVTCQVGGQGRWIDTKTWVWEFANALPGGISCEFALNDGLKTLAGGGISGQTRFTVDTGGPSVRTVLPGRYDGDIEEDQVFLVATNVRADPASVAANGYCAVDGVGEKIALDVLKPEVAGDVLAGLGAERYEVTNFLGEAGLPQALPANAAERTKALPRSWRSSAAGRCRRGATWLWCGDRISPAAAVWPGATSVSTSPCASSSRRASNVRGSIRRRGAAPCRRPGSASPRRSRDRPRRRSGSRWPTARC
jgi:hypothetical protein